MKPRYGKHSLEPSRQHACRRHRRALAIACGVLAVLVCATGAFAAYLGGIDSSLAGPASAGEQQAIDEALSSDEE